MLQESPEQRLGEKMHLLIHSANIPTLTAHGGHQTSLPGTWVPFLLSATNPPYISAQEGSSWRHDSASLCFLCRVLAASLSAYLMVPFGKRRWLRVPHTPHLKPPNPETSETLLLCYGPQQAFPLPDFWSKDKSHRNVADWTFKLSGIIFPWNLTNLGLHKKKRESQQPETNPLSRGHWCGCCRQRQPEKIMGVQGGDAEWLVSLSQIVSSHWETQAWFTEGPAKQLSNCWKNFLCILLVLMLGFMDSSKISSSWKLAFPRVFCPREVLPRLLSVFPPCAWCPLSREKFSWSSGGPSVHDNDVSITEQSDVSRNARSCPCESCVGKEASKSRINTKAHASSGARLRRAPLQCNVHLCPKALPCSCALLPTVQRGP